MSQLSSNARKSRNKQPKNNAKKTLYFLIIFTIVCLGITTACIINTLTLRKQKNKISENNVQSAKDYAYVSLTDKYLTNGINVKTTTEHDGRIIETFEIGDPIYEYEICYDEISGLKNTKIQDKINKDIQEEVEKAKEKLEENPEYERISVMAFVTGNFSDVLSVSIDYTLINTSEDYDIRTEFIGLNYRLDTGERLKFNDLFFDNASIKRILSNSAYKAYAMEHIFNQDDDYSMDLDDTDYGYVENKVFKVITAYNRNQDLNFYFSQTSIYISINGFQIPIDMEEYRDSIAIYTKYISKNLYTGEKQQKEIYAFTDAFLSDSYEVENTRGDNFYYEVMTYNYYDNKNTEVPVKARKTLDEKLERYYNIAKENPDKGYFVSIIYFFDPAGEDPYYQYDGYVSETDIDYYNENRDLIIATARRQVTGEVWCYDYSMIDNKVEFYERFSAYVDNYMYDEYQEDILTKEDWEKMFNESEEE